jgi:uncharacterized coiled-coil protein SlyX
MKKLTNIEIIKILSDAVKSLQDEVKVLEKGLKLVNNKLKKYENKTIGGFNSYLSPRDIGADDEMDY